MTLYILFSVISAWANKKFKAMFSHKPENFEASEAKRYGKITGVKQWNINMKHMM